MKVKSCETEYGVMSYFENDLWIGESLEMYGEFSAREVCFLESLLDGDSIFVDVGANIGCLTIPMAKKVKQVYAIEPQPNVVKVLEENIANNGLENVTLVEAACAEKNGEFLVPAPEVSFDCSGSYSVMGDSLKKVSLKHCSIDSIDLGSCHLIKIDIQGGEIKALLGCQKTLEKYRPIFYVEAETKAMLTELVGFFQKSSYSIWWHKPPLYRVDNYKMEQHNIFGEVVSSNLLALPEEVDFTDLVENALLASSTTLEPLFFD